MEEIITVDGRQYKLSYDQHMITEQRLQVIENIRKSNEHNTYNEMARALGQTGNVRWLSTGMSIS